MKKKTDSMRILNLPPQTHSMAMPLWNIVVLMQNIEMFKQ